MARRSWALALAEECVPINNSLQENNERIDIIHRGVAVGLENLKSHVANLESKFREAQAWADDLLKEQKSALDGWQNALDKLKAIPARKDVTFLGRPSTPKKGIPDQSSGTLQDFVDVDEVRRAASKGALASQSFSRRLDEIQTTVTSISVDTQNLLQRAQPPVIEGSQGLLGEVETLAKKVSSDYEHVLGLPSNQKSLANISRLALAHTKELLPSLREISLELHTASDQAARSLQTAMKDAVNHMRIVSSLESRLADAQSQIAHLDVDADVFDVVFQVYHLPLAYGSVLVEAVRRREWSEKLKSDSLTLAEEMAVIRDEEQRRRKKWLKSIGELVTLHDDSTPGLEINLQGQEQEWPEIHRKDIELYIDVLKAQTDMTAVVEEVAQIYAEIDKPTRQQKRRARAFKQGSVIDLGRSSLLLRGDDMVRSLQDEKLKLEDKLKSSESRIRKLEDLLHRQTHIARPLSGNFSADFPGSPASPRPDPLSRRSSVSSRRMSSNQTAEEKGLVQRIVGLEADLATERETVQRLQREARMERQSSTDKIQEAQSTKEDLIKNLESRQKEFEDERKFLEADAKQLRHRIEELEEELFQALDRRDNEKQELQERVQSLERQLEAAEASTAERIEAAQQESAALQGKFDREVQRVNELQSVITTDKEKQSIAKAKYQELEDQLEKLRKDNRENLSTLQAAHAILSPERSAPSDFASLVKAIEIMAEGLTIHARNMEKSNASLSQEKKELEEKLELSLAETAALRESKLINEAELSQAQTELSQKRSRISVLESEVANERSHLHNLQSKIAAGETGSEALRERLAEEETKNAAILQELNYLREKTQTASEEAKVEREKSVQARDSEKRLTEFLSARGNRAQEISQRLLTQAERMGHMLEQLGFAVVQTDNKLTVQRASKVNSASVSGELLSSSTVASLRPDPSLSAWVQDGADEEDIKFQEFMDSMAKFDVEVFSEAIVKREKDIEVLARKWQKEARSYRDKYHRAQSEAHEKIAFRSFKEGDLALFLPTRNQAIRSWAAFNVGAPHYFLREQDVHKLSTRDWLLARIGKIEERVVDLSKSMNGGNQDRHSIASDGTSFDDENPFELSDGLRWYLLDATEEKPGAPSTPGLGKSTVASAHVDAKGSIRLKRTTGAGNVAKTLTKSLDSRRNSSTSKKGTPVPTLVATESVGDNVRPADADASVQPREADPLFDEVRRDLLRRKS